jgi:hypothetical protein
LASPAQSVFQVPFGAYIDPSFFWHRKTWVPRKSVTYLLFGNHGAKFAKRHQKL